MKYLIKLIAWDSNGKFLSQSANYSDLADDEAAKLEAKNIWKVTPGAKKEVKISCKENTILVYRNWQ